ncbi:DUF4232 domain-containing protein [Pseudomonas sp. PDM25]|uniref:DUF4232 domain-containing protein n=1 Tax=Pseudomonas sp. PDM25 TaxID=2854772 RepID=UPI0035C6684B
MSQRGTLLVLRNNGPHTCQLGALPTLRFEGSGGRRRPVDRRLPRGMHPGPVLLPIAVAPGVEVAMLLHWVSGDVYPGHNCLTPVTAVLDLSEGALRVPFGLPMCAAVGSTEFFDQAPPGVRIVVASLDLPPKAHRGRKETGCDVLFTRTQSRIAQDVASPAEPDRGRGLSPGRSQ